MRSVRIIWKKKSPKDKKGYIRLSTRIGNKTKTKNLPLEPIDKRFFNKNTQRVRTSFPNHEFYNNTIEKTLFELRTKQPSNLLLINDEKRSFLLFLNQVIERISVTGTKQKYQNLHNQLHKFSSSVYGDMDVRFSDISVEFLSRFSLWLRQEQQNSVNTTNDKLKLFKSIVKKGILERMYSYDINPFDLLEKKTNEVTSIEVLDKEDLNRLINTELFEVYRNRERFGEKITDERVLRDPRYKHKISLDSYRRFFLFQLFCQGLRVSDISTLRWNNFRVVKKVSEQHGRRKMVFQLRIVKRMVKTKGMIDILVNNHSIDHLRPFIPVEKLDERHRQKFEKVLDDYVRKTGREQEVEPYTYHSKHSLVLDDRKVKEHNLRFEKIDGFYRLSQRDVKHELKHHRDIGNTGSLPYLNKILDDILFINDQQLNKITNIRKRILGGYYREMTQIIGFLSTNESTRNNFCFPLLNDKDFESIGSNNDFGLMTPKQYSKFTGARVYYNRLLKVVQEQCGIKKKLTTHISRHSYTSLMLEIGENLDLFDLMKSLGHKHLNTTQKYIQKFNNPNIDILNEQLSDYIRGETY